MRGTVARRLRGAARRLADPKLRDKILSKEMEHGTLKYPDKSYKGLQRIFKRAYRINRKEPA